MKSIFMCLILLAPSLTWAASCCGGGFSVPALILGDDKAQVTGSLSNGRVTDDILNSGKWLKRQDNNLTQTLKVEGAILLSDRWQGGFSLPLTSKSIQNASSSSGLGDISLYLGHESFPEKSFSNWKPKGVSYLQVVLPTSPSVYDVDSASSTDIRGRGFYSFGAGVALLKAWTVWDANFNTEIHHAMPKDITNSLYGGPVSIQPGWGFSQTWGLGWNRGLFRLGSSLSFLYEDPIRIAGATETTSALQRSFTFGLTGSYMPSAETAITLSYSDQSLIGIPLNSSLSQTINLSFQHRWPR